MKLRCCLPAIMAIAVIFLAKPAWAGDQNYDFGLESASDSAAGPALANNVGTTEILDTCTETDGGVDLIAGSPGDGNAAIEAAAEVDGKMRPDACGSGYCSTTGEVSADICEVNAVMRGEAWPLSGAGVVASDQIDPVFSRYSDDCDGFESESHSECTVRILWE